MYLADCQTYGFILERGKSSSCKLILPLIPSSFTTCFERIENADNDKLLERERGEIEFLGKSN